MSVYSFGAITDYSKGYVITNHNDTIYGLLQFGGNKHSTAKCILKDSITNQEKQYTPDDILAYRFVDGKYYVSKLLTDSLQSKRVFMEYLVKGIVDIYYFPGNDNGRYFMDKGDGKIIELKNTRYLTEQDDKKYFRYRNEYVTELSQVFQDSPKTCEQLMRSELDYKSLTGLVVSYHKDKCTSEDCVVYKKQLTKEKIHGGILLGVNYGDFSKGKSNNNDIFKDLLLKSMVYPSVGAFLEMRFPYINNDLLCARLESSVFYETTSGKNKILNRESTGTYSINDKKLSLRNYLLCRLDLGRSKCRPFIDLGVFTKFAISSHSEVNYDLQYTGSSHVYSSFSEGKSNFLKQEAGPAAGLGLKFKINSKRYFYTSFRYSWCLGLVSDYHFKVNLPSLNAGFQLF